MLTRSGCLGGPTSRSMWTADAPGSPRKTSSAADAFELGATFRQLTELYGLAGPGAPPEFNPLVSSLLEALLRRDAGYHELTVQRETEEVHASMGDFERTFQDGTLVAI